MRKYLLLTAAMFLMAWAVQAQTDTMYIMKNGAVVGKYSIITEVDSMIFYHPSKTSDPITMPGDTFTDNRDGQVYRYVTIGNQAWMAENLNYDAGSGSYCSSLKVSNCDIYGRLYDWNTAMAGASSSETVPSGVQGVCPSGWHLPSDAEWDTLASFVANETGLTGKTDDDWTEIGVKLKAKTNWYSSGNGSDDYGFTALPGGYRRGDNGQYQHLGFHGFWWSATQVDASVARRWYLEYNNEILHRENGTKTFGYSVRCIKD
jgi:uncharacterized protein (TIGR02145 family)